MNKINKTAVTRVEFKDIDVGTVFEPDMFHTDGLFIKTDRRDGEGTWADDVICVNLENGTTETFTGNMVVTVYNVTIDATTYRCI